MVQAVTGVYMVILMQEDLQASTEFYKKLGLKVVFHIPGKWSELEVGGMKIGLCPSPATAKGHHSGLVFQVADVMATYAALKEEGIAFLNEPTVAAHGIMVSCADPSGNMFDLYQPTLDKMKQAIDEAHGLCGGGACGVCETGSCRKSSKPKTGCC